MKWLANHWCDMMSAWLIGPVWCQLRGANTQWQFQGCRPQCETVLGASFLLLLHFLLLGLIYVCLIFNNQKWNHRAIKVNKDILILSSVWIHMYSGYLACHKYLWWRLVALVFLHVSVLCHLELPCMSSYME